MKFILLNCLLFISLSAFGVRDDTVDSLLSVLDREIQNEPFHLARKWEKTNHIRQLMVGVKDPKIRFELNRRLYEQYLYYKYDSSLYYLDQNLVIARKLKDYCLENEVLLLKTELYIINGIFWEAEHTLHKIAFEDLTCDQQRSFRENKIRLIYFMYSTASDSTNRNNYLEAFRESDGMYGETHDDTYKIPYDISFYRLLEQSRIGELRDLCEKAFLECEMGERLYSFTCQWRSILARLENDRTEQLYYLALAAISDQRGCIKNNNATYHLAKLVFDSGDLERAHAYINTILGNANVSDSPLLKSRVSDLVAEINQKHAQRIIRQRKLLIGFSLTVCILLFILLQSLLKLFKQMKKLKVIQEDLVFHNRNQREMNKRLNELNVALSQNNQAKERCIGIFLGMRPHYIQKMENYRKQVLKFLKNGRIADLHEFCKSDRNIEEELGILFKEFDQMFLSILPTFIDEFNALLQEDARIKPKPGELTIELRIYALIRLGVKDSAHIAEHLRYSVNTIYNYRSRIKNKALVARVDFESEVLKIGVGKC